MYPTLYHALLDLTGLDLPGLKFLNSFGFFVALAFMAASWTLFLGTEAEGRPRAVEAHHTHRHHRCSGHGGRTHQFRPRWLSHRLEGPFTCCSISARPRPTRKASC